MKNIELSDLFKGLQKEMKYNLDLYSFISHPGSKGDATEKSWIDFLRTYLPDRYKVDKAIVIDAEGAVSKQIDVVIYDGMYTPFIFNHKGFKYVPAESVYAVFEVKQDIKGNIKYAAESVRKLKRTSIGMVSSGIVMRPRSLTKIIGGILTTENSYIDKKTPVKKQLSNLTGYETIDMGCCCDLYSFYVDYDEKNDLSKSEMYTNEWIKSIYESRVVKDINKDISFNEKVPLFAFFLQLVNSLKSIGTVPAIDVNAYLKSIEAEIR